MDNDELVIDLFAALFEGNGDRLGTDDGGSVETIEWWIDAAEAHLTGESEPIGAYPIDPRDGLCKWGCIDFDNGEMSWTDAVQVAYFLQCHDIVSWIERSRSKGYHVWVFCTEWINPKIMRHALLYSCEFVGAPTKEINPKQVSLDEGQVGNYVRLPYPAGLLYDELQDEPSNQEKRWMVDGLSGHTIPLRMFVMDAWDNRCEPVELAELASRYHPPPPIGQQTVYVANENYDSTDELLERLSKDARRLFENGPKTSDRSSALVALAGRIARDGSHIPEEIALVVHKADEHWGKYTQRGDGDVRIAEIVEKVVSERDSWY